MTKKQEPQADDEINWQGYMSHCIESLLPGGEELEILIVNDGFTDDTQIVVEKFRKMKPCIIRAFKRENGETERLGQQISKSLFSYTGRRKHLQMRS